MTDNQKAFLDMIAWSEIGPALLAASDNGYNVLVGSTPQHPILFDSYTDHPHKTIRLSVSLMSSAAGRYQILGKYFDAYKKLLNLPDFSPNSQDRIAIQYLKECRALVDVDAGNIPVAITKCAHIWASLAGAGYDQHENSVNDLLTAYQDAGGDLA